VAQLIATSFLIIEVSQQAVPLGLLDHCIFTNLWVVNRYPLQPARTCVRGHGCVLVLIRPHEGMRLQLFRHWWRRMETERFGGSMCGNWRGLGWSLLELLPSTPRRTCLLRWWSASTMNRYLPTA